MSGGVHARIPAPAIAAPLSHHREHPSLQALFGERFFIAWSTLAGMAFYLFRSPGSCSCPWLGHMYHKLTRSCGRKIPDETLRQMLNCAIRHNRCFKFGGGKLTNKHHIWIHLIHQSKLLGNPRLRSTMPNESLNGVVANVGKTCHRATFVVSVFAKLELLCRFKGNIMLGAHKETLHLK